MARNKYLRIIGLRLEQGANLPGMGDLLDPALDDLRVVSDERRRKIIVRTGERMTPPNEQKTILSLCDYSGAWSKPYRETGYNVVQVDLQLGQDVRLLNYPGKVHGILAAPPCTHLASSGARWWKEKGEQALLDSLAVADACLRFVALCNPVWWALENPVGRLVHYYGKPAYSFHPYQFGDPYTKKTNLWGEFTPPLPLFVGKLTEVEPTEGSKMWRLPPSQERQNMRSETPAGFAQAFFRSNP